MAIKERRQKLIEILRNQPGLGIPELAVLLDASQAAIRSDLNDLNEEGSLMYMRDGSSASAETQNRSFNNRLRKNHAAKECIARCVAELVKDGDSLVLDASTSVYCLAHYLKKRNGLHVITNGIEAAKMLARNPTNRVVLLGGALNADGTTISGTLSEQFLRESHVKMTFISCSGISPEDGLTEHKVEEATLKLKMIHAADKTIALVDSSKFGQADVTSFAQVNQVTHLYTDQDLAPAWIEWLQQSGMKFSLCGKEGLSTFTPNVTKTRRYRIGFANQCERLPFAVEVRESLERAAHNAGNIDLVLADNQLDAQTALMVAENFLTKHLDLIIEYQIDEHMGNRITGLYQLAGIPVIAVDIPMRDAIFFGVDNYRAGHMTGQALGEWVRDHWNGKYDLLITLEEPRAGPVPAARITGQLEGLQEVIGPLPAEKRLVLDCGNLPDVSDRAMQAALARFPNLHRIACICFNDPAAIGALEAARRLGRERDVVIVGQGAERRVREEMARPGSRIIASTAYWPERYGEKLIQLAQCILRGDTVPRAVHMEHTLIKAGEPPT